MNKTYPVSVNRINCEKVKLKDSINLLYSVKGDRFFFKN